MFANFHVKCADLLVTAIFTGNCLKQFHFRKGSEQKSRKEKMRNSVFFSF